MIPSPWPACVVASLAAMPPGCTHSRQAVPAEVPQAAVEAPQSAAAVSAATPSALAGNAAVPAGGPKRIHVLPPGCVPPGKKFACNPLSNAGCKPDGEACDDDEKGGFTCYPPPNEVREGGECNDKEGPSCAAGMSCDTPNQTTPSGICRRLCCSSADCGTSKKCVAVDLDYGSFGFCK